MSEIVSNVISPQYVSKTLHLMLNVIPDVTPGSEYCALVLGGSEAAPEAADRPSGVVRLDTVDSSSQFYVSLLPGELSTSDELPDLGSEWSARFGWVILVHQNNK